MHCTWNIQEMIISMQQFYIDVNKSHSEDNIIYAVYKTKLYYLCSVQEIFSEWY